MPVKSAIAISPVATVVRRIDDQCNVQLACFLEFCNEEINGEIGIVYCGGIDGGVILEVSIDRDDLIGRCKFGVRSLKQLFTKKMADRYLPWFPTS